MIPIIILSGIPDISNKVLKHILKHICVSRILGPFSLYIHIKTKNMIDPKPNHLDIEINL